MPLPVIVCVLLFTFSPFIYSTQSIKEDPVATPYKHSHIYLQGQNIAKALNKLNIHTPKLNAVLASANHNLVKPNNVQKTADTLDDMTLFEVDMSVDGQIKISKGKAKALLNQAGWKNYLLKINNPKQLTGGIVITSPNALPTYHKSVGEQFAMQEHFIDPNTMKNSFLELAIYRDTPVASHVEGYPTEYRILQIYTRAKETRTA